MNGEERNQYQERERSFPKYSISVVSVLCGVRSHTLRRFEQNGLVQPARTEGETRRYSDEDLELIREIARLANLGVNHAGIREVLRLRRQWHEMRRWPGTSEDDTDRQDNINGRNEQV